MRREESHSDGPADILQIPGEDNDLRSILAEIERRVEERRKEGVYRDLEIQDLERERLGEETKPIDLDPVHELFTDPLHELSFLLQFTRQYSDINTYYPIGARPGPLRPFIVLAKRIIRRFMTPYMEVVFAKQRAFNEKLVQSLEAILEMMRVEKEREYRGGVDRYSAWVEMGLRSSAEDLLEEAAGRFEPGKQVVNLYSGLGDFLEASHRRGVKAVGVEGDSRLVSMCQREFLKVYHVDPLDFLKSCPMESMPGVFVEGLGERGEAGDLLWTVSELADKLEKEGRLVLLNHHPKSFRGVEEAFRDPTVLRLVHPETMKGLLLKAGFREVGLEMMDGPASNRGDDWVEGLAIPEGEETRALVDMLSGPRFYLLEARR